MKKRNLAAMLAAVMVVGSSMTSFAGTWQKDSTGWWWRNDDGSYPVNTWQWLDGNGDGVAECYYFDGNGYMLANTTTPDGYQVNENGAWIELGIVRTKSAEVPTAMEQTNGNIPSGYNEDGLSNIVIDMLEHTRTENAKYNESSVMDLGGHTRIFYDNYGFSAEYSGLEGTENEKPLFVGSSNTLNLFSKVNITSSIDGLYAQLKNDGFNVTTNGGSVRIDLGKYGVLIDRVHAEAYINFDYRQ